MLLPHFLESALESAPDAIVICDESGAIVFANRQVGTLFGYDREEILGRPVEHLVPERYRARHAGHRSDFANNPRVRPMGAGLKLHALHRNGTEFPVEISLSAIVDASGTLFAAAIRDVTDRQRIEAELIAAREAADRANRAKSRFLATASHDLRQPLQALSLLNGTLRRIPMGPPASEALAQQELAITGMSRLVNALLDISKLESGAIRPEITDFTVRSLFEQLQREFAAPALEKGLELRVENCEESVRSDLSLVGQILRNLVSNAIKYTRSGRVQLRCLHEAAVVGLEVLDTGIGIPGDQVQYIFDEFFQVGGGRGASRDGYGLGLSIVNRLVKLLDVKLDVQSTPGKGSSFRLDLPSSRLRLCEPAVVPARRTTAQHRDRGSARRVLFVEDDAGVRRASRMLLEAEGYEVETAASLAEALERLAGPQGFDLLVADYHLGAETGMEVIAAVRARIGEALGAILVTGDTSPAVQGLEHDERLRIASKPLEAEQLLALMSTLLT